MIAIRNMKELPKSCIECPFIKAEGTKFFCSRIMKYIDNKNLENRHNDCPLVEIVTCKDCRHRRGDICRNVRHFISDDFYCAGGERKV